MEGNLILIVPALAALAGLTMIAVGIGIWVHKHWNIVRGALILLMLYVLVCLAPAFFGSFFTDRYTILELIGINHAVVAVSLLLLSPELGGFIHWVFQIEEAN